MNKTKRVNCEDRNSENSSVSTNSGKLCDVYMWEVKLLLIIFRSVPNEAMDRCKSL